MAVKITYNDTTIAIFETATGYAFSEEKRSPEYNFLGIYRRENGELTRIGCVKLDEIRSFEIIKENPHAVLSNPSA